MNDTQSQSWQRFQKYYTEFPAAGLAVDLSRMDIPDDFTSRMDAQLEAAFAAMAELERGKIANPDEKRMVGHYWLRNPALAPNAEFRKEIEEAITKVKVFANQVHTSNIAGAAGSFKNLLLIGIGGSALGPQFVANALSDPTTDKLRVFFFDNTDPDGMDKVLAQLQGQLGQTLCVVVSKSGGTKETRNGMLEAEAAYKSAGFSFAAHAVAITSAGSELDNHAVKQKWIDRFPMWDWVGGRTSELSPVGLLPAALQGLDIDGLLAGAKAIDELTRIPSLKDNPAAQLALAWYFSGNGKGSKNMVVLPYKDRLELLAKYLQQLIMESLGKRLDLDGRVVNQGITVLGNKGATDQHSYIQQLRDGLDNFFVTFIEVLKDRSGSSICVEPEVRSGDFLLGFLLGTRRALYESGRKSITLTVTEVSPFSIGVLIGLFERVVGLYAILINVNAYHQPGVEAGKKAASEVLALQGKIVGFLAKASRGATADEIAQAVGEAVQTDTVFKICEHLAGNADRRVEKICGATPFLAQFRMRLAS